MPTIVLSSEESKSYSPIAYVPVERTYEKYLRKTV